MSVKNKIELEFAGLTLPVVQDEDGRGGVAGCLGGAAGGAGLVSPIWAGVAS